MCGRLLPGRGVIARTGSISGACGRECKRGAGASLDVADAGAGVVAEVVRLADADTEGDAVGVVAAGIVLGGSVGVGVGVGLFFVVDLLCFFFAGVADGPVNIRFSLSLSVSPSQARAAHTTGMSATKQNTIRRFTSPV